MSLKTCSHSHPSIFMRFCARTQKATQAVRGKGGERGALKGWSWCWGIAHDIYMYIPYMTIHSTTPWFCNTSKASNNSGIGITSLKAPTAIGRTQVLLMDGIPSRVCLCFRVVISKLRIHRALQNTSRTRTQKRSQAPTKLTPSFPRAAYVVDKNNGAGAATISILESRHRPPCLGVEGMRCYRGVIVLMAHMTAMLDPH